MFHPLSHQLYTYEHGRTVAEQRAADIRLGVVAAGLRDLRLRVGRAFRPRHRMLSACGTAGAVTEPVRVVPDVR